MYSLRYYKNLQKMEIKVNIFLEPFHLQFLLILEAVGPKCSVKKVSKIYQNSLENIAPGVSFLIK